MNNKSIIKLGLTALLCAMPFIFSIVFFDIKLFVNYKISNLNINSTVQSDGDVSVKQTMVYEFNKSTDSVKFSVHSGLINYDDVISMSIDELNDDGTTTGFKEVIGEAYITQNSYIESYSREYINCNIYFPETDKPKTFIVNYTLKNIALKHLDCSELYWNFLGDRYSYDIDNFNLNINIGQNNAPSELTKAYLHGPNDGNLNIISNSDIQVNYKNLKPNQDVAVRIIFDQNAIYDSSNISNYKAIPTIIKSEQKFEKLSNSVIVVNIIIILLIIGILAYWIYLIIKYHYDRIFKVYYPDDMELMNKYNPIIAACIAQKRDMQSRDIVAILIDLVNRKILKIETVKIAHGNIDNTIYKIRKDNTFFNDGSKVNQLDEIEKRVIDIFYGDSEDDIIELEKQLNKINEKSGVTLKIKLLSKTIKNKLHEIGTDFIKVPDNILGFNNVLFFVVCIIIFFNVIYNNIIAGITLLDSSIKISDILNNTTAFIILFTPILLFIVYIVMYILRLISKQIEKIVFKLTPNKVNQTMFLYIALSIIIILILLCTVEKTYIILDSILLMVTIILINTDNLLSTHSRKMTKTFLSLKVLEDKLKNGSLLKEKEIKDVVLWGKYLVYAIAFGISNVEEYTKIIDKDASKYIREFTYDTLFNLNKYINFTDNVLSIYDDINTNIEGFDFSSDIDSSKEIF